ncbi:MAG TPA: hypothetical protein PL078_03570 [Bacillota bacterium]|nr:hypothetical protein [Peptococcaceae bacterium]HPZ43064.1 hypothetical protein [Bacillota bacterium]HQD75802.1 hypothetical protein [Bacillota bacterium]HUM58473.1 hypothetical protein [Bacillota bacterium]
MSADLGKKPFSSDLDSILQSTGSSLLELRIKKELRAARRTRLENQQKEREETESLKELAKYESALAKKYIEECKNILRNNLAAGKFDWISYYKDEPYPPFVFKEPLPRYELIAREMGINRKDPIKEFFLPSLKKRRLEMEEEARRLYNLKLEEYRQREKSARAAYELKRKIFLEEQSQYNNSIDQLRLDLAKGQPGAVESFARTLLSLMKYPDAFEVEFDARYEQRDRLLVVEGVFCPPQEIPRTILYQYDEEEHGITPVEMEEQEFADFYQEILLQLSLSAIHLIFLSCPGRLVEQVVFNGRVRAINHEVDPGEPQPCILTCRVNRDLYRCVDLSSVSPRAAFLRFNGIMSTPLTALKPVVPIQKMRPKPSPYPEPDPVPETQTSTPSPAPYQPGEIENMAKELVSDILEQIGNNWGRTGGQGGIIH